MQILHHFSARPTRKSSAIVDERTYTDDECTDADDGCTFIGDGGTFSHGPVRNIV